MAPTALTHCPQHRWTFFTSTVVSARPTSAASSSPARQPSISNQDLRIVHPLVKSRGPIQETQRGFPRVPGNRALPRTCATVGSYDSRDEWQEVIWPCFPLPSIAQPQLTHLQVDSLQDLGRLLDVLGARGLAE